MNFSKKKIDYVLIFIFFYFCLSIISYKHNLSNFDKNNITDKGFYHVMIKGDAHRHLKHGAEIKKDLDEGINYFKTGRDSFSEYIPARFAAAYYFLFDYDLFIELLPRIKSLARSLQQSLAAPDWYCP